ncbi:MAG: hypothetical protein HXY34_03630 [Candidatus Thorarchaeota archaeon]|nr:hypothetical protein [Candidatus Thorarchaeota archaeon]
MEGIFVIDDAGITRASVGFEHLKGDAMLFGGFLSALQIFVKHVSGDEVRELKFGELQLLMSRINDGYVVTLHTVADTKAETRHRAVVRMLSEKVGPIDDGFVCLLKDLMAIGDEASEMAKQELFKWSKSTLDEIREKAKEWGEKVF